MARTARNKPFQRIVLIVSALLALALGYWLGNQYARPPLEGVSATVLPEPRPIGEFKLLDHTGEPASLASLRGHWSFVFFGYTHCPDICPGTLLLFSRVYNRLAERPDLQATTRMTLVSVDPDRDTPEQLRDYVTYFNPEFVGITGSEAEIANLARQFSVVYVKQAAEDGSGDYQIDHSASIFLVNPQGGLHAIFSGTQDPESIASDFLRIVDHAG